MAFSKIFSRAFCVLVVLWLGLGSLQAQRPGPGGRPPGPPGGPPGGRRPGGPPPDGPRRGGPPGGQGDFRLLESELRFGDRLVKGAPYAAQAVAEQSQVLADGTRITRQMKALLYRDGEGRTRREQTLSFIGQLVPGQSAPPQMVFITDPVANAFYAINQGEKTARRMPWRPNAAPPLPPPPAAASDVVTESLGKKSIEGVEAEGTRTTITIPAGQIGNDRPLKIVSERWYSPELQIVVLSAHTDPRLGEHSYRLTDIKRSEPARSLFEIPADYRLEKEGGRPGGPPRKPQ